VNDYLRRRVRRTEKDAWQHAKYNCCGWRSSSEGMSLCCLVSTVYVVVFPGGRNRSFVGMEQDQVRHPGSQSLWNNQLHVFGLKKGVYYYYIARVPAPQLEGRTPFLRIK
jgi:hypothetical protein